MYQSFSTANFSVITAHGEVQTPRTEGHNSKPADVVDPAFSFDLKWVNLQVAAGRLVVFPRLLRLSCRLIDVCGEYSNKKRSPYKYNIIESTS